MTASIDGKTSEYWVTDNIQKQFFETSHFCLSVQDYIMKMLSIEIEISSARVPPKKNWHDIEIYGYKIQLVGYTHMDQYVIQQSMSDLISNYLKRIQSIVCTNSTVLKWFRMGEVLTKFLPKLINEKVLDLFTTISIEGNTMKFYYLSKDPSSDVNGKKLESFVQNDILQEIISLPLSHERSSQLEIEFERLQAEENIIDDEVLIVSGSLNLKVKQKEIVLFGYHQKVIELKKKLLEIIERNILITYKLPPINQFLTKYSLHTHYKELQDVEENYTNFGVKIRLNSNEFSAPEHLKDKIQSAIEQFLSRLSTTTTQTFQTIQLLQTIAANEEKPLKSIARKNRCYIQTNSPPTSQSHSVPKASISNTQASKSILAQSELFSSSPDVFKKMMVGNGSIELRTGDVALQEVDTIVISTTFNGLKEGLIDRAGPFDYEKTHAQPDGIMYTETDGEQLKCKRILFSNWTPTTLINRDQTLRTSIQVFVAKSLEYTKEAPSIAFAVPDSCANEAILAREITAEVKRHLENDKLEQKISFVLLPEQKTLYEQFAELIETPPNVYACFDWPMTVMKITLTSPDDRAVTRCQVRITKYLSRCASSAKLTHPNGIFHSWDQHTINSFYKYCQDRCVLPKFDEIENILELTGLPSGVQQAKRQWQTLTELVQRTPIIERPSSAMNRSGAKLYNIVLSYSRKDIRRCQRLINRLTEEGFSLGTDPNLTSKKRDVCSQMDKCDCIILCISENYYENSSCREEAKYAFQTDQKVFLVKIRNRPFFNWDYELFEGKLFFRSFGSNEFFDFEYGRLLLQLLRYTKPGFSSLLQRRSSYVQQDIDDIRGISKIERSKVENTKPKSVPSPRQLTLSEKRWLQILSNILEMPENNYEISNARVRSVLSPSRQFPSDGCDSEYHSRYTIPSHPVTGQPSIRTLIDEDQIYGQDLQIQSYTDSSQTIPKGDLHDDFVPRRKNPNSVYPNEMSNWCVGTKVRTEEEMEHRRKLDNPEEMKDRREQLVRYFMGKYQRYTQEQMDMYSTFAQRMKENTVAFETYCSTKTITHLL